MELLYQGTPALKKNFIRGSLKRKKYKGTNKCYLFKYAEVTADLLNGNCFLEDKYVNDLFGVNSCNKKVIDTYYIALEEYIKEKIQSMELTDEEIYSGILKLRIEIFGRSVCRSSRRTHEKRCSTTINGIDQKKILIDKLKSYSTIYMIIEEDKYINLFIDMYKRILSQGVNPKIVIHENPIHPKSISYHELKKSFSKSQLYINSFDLIPYEELGIDYSTFLVDKGSTLVCYGEWFLGANKNLLIDSYVCCTSEEILTRDACNALDKEEVQFVYIPKEYDLISQLKLTEISLMNYRILSWIYDEIGDIVYTHSTSDLLKNYPNYFINYKSDKLINSINFHYNQDFYADRIKSITEYLSVKSKYLKISSEIFIDSSNNQMKVVGALIDAEKFGKMKVISFEKATNIKKYFRDYNPSENSSEKSKTDRVSVISNFLFFSTDVSMDLYNKIRSDRKKEQYNETGWHLDYKYENNSEWVPLYNKATILLTRENKLVFKKSKLNSGLLSINELNLHIEDLIIDPNEKIIDDDVVIYTPMYCKLNTENFRETRLSIGNNRINMIFINNEIICIRNGDVILPNIGIVISMTYDFFTKSFGEMKTDEKGYYEVGSFTCMYSSLETMDVKWAYGGGMFLIENGLEYSDKVKLLDEFRNEGWLNDLSKQTQGSLTYKIEKHPRTAIGETVDGKFFIIVCSGRSQSSVGADYFDLIRIAKDTYGEIRNLVNIDGGASSMLAFVVDDEIIPLTDITYTEDSAAGEVRKLNSIMHIEM